MEGRILGILWYNIPTFVAFDAEVQLADLHHSCRRRER